MTTRRSWILACLGVLILSFASWAFMQTPAPGRTLAEFVPSGPVLLLEAQNFSQLVEEWNSSSEKQQWLDSANYQMFSRSRLFYRLGEAHAEFAAAAGFSPGMPLVQSIAGGESALALYDIGELRFLYITRLGSARTLENMLWQSRANFEPRNAAGLSYYVRTDTPSGRQVAFAATDEYLLLATAEDPLAQALTLIAGQSSQPVTNDAWYRDATQASEGRGELRLSLNMEALARSPHFRSYWVQRNVSALRQYRAGVIDLHREAGAMREQRVFLRAADYEGPPADDARNAGLAQVLRLVPPRAGLYRAWASPEPEQVVEVLTRKLLEPTTEALRQSDYAPRVVLSDGTVGGQAALETRIDEPPPAVSNGRFSAEPLQELLARNAAGAMLHTESSRSQAGQVFVTSDVVVTLLGASDWDFADVLQSLASSVRGRLTVSEIGAEWAQQSIGGRTAYALTSIRAAVCRRSGPLSAHLELGRVAGCEPGSDDSTGGPGGSLIRGGAAPRRARQLPDAHGSSRLLAGRRVVRERATAAVLLLGKHCQPQRDAGARGIGFPPCCRSRDIGLGYRDLPTTAMIRPRSRMALCALGVFLSGALHAASLLGPVVDSFLRNHPRGDEIACMLSETDGREVIYSRWPNFDRPVPLGSLVKPFTALAYAESHGGRFPRIDCTPQSGCWLPSGHGNVGIERALALSCNAYFRGLSEQISNHDLAAVTARFGLAPPPHAAPSRAYFGLGGEWQLAPVALVRAYEEFLKRSADPAIGQILAGLKAAAENGTAAGVSRALGGRSSLAKTGTSPCIHPNSARHSNGDGYALVLHPADAPRYTLLVRVHGVAGREAANLAGEILRVVTGPE